MAAIDADDVRVPPIEHRLAEAMRLPSLAVWIVPTLMVLVLCTAWHKATRVWSGIEVGGEAFWRTPWRLEIVFAVILGYVFACGCWIVRCVRRDLDALAPVLAIEPSELAIAHGQQVDESHGNRALGSWIAGALVEWVVSRVLG